MTIFWALEASFVFLEVFPTVWLEWWSSAATNGHDSTAKYLGVYAALQIGALIALFGTAMYVMHLHLLYLLMLTIKGMCLVS